MVVLGVAVSDARLAPSFQPVVQDGQEADAFDATGSPDDSHIGSPLPADLDRYGPPTRRGFVSFHALRSDRTSMATSRPPPFP